jgi:hypothetical protein
MEHWIAAVLASIVGVAMAVVVVVVSFNVAGPEPQHNFSNQPTVGTAASQSGPIDDLP